MLISRLLCVFVLVTMMAAAAGVVASTSAVEAPVGTRVILFAQQSDDGGAAVLWYRFRIRSPGESRFYTVRDFGPVSRFEWAAGPDEGPYEIELSVRAPGSGEIETSVTQVEVTSRVTGSEPVVSPTENQLVFLYSAPPCAPGSRLSVTFTSEQGIATTTPPHECTQGRNVNLYLAGLRAETRYSVRHSIESGRGIVEQRPALEFGTPALPFTPTRADATQAGAGPARGVVYHNRLFEESVATDLQGNVLWYYPIPNAYIIGPQKGGTFLALIEDKFGPDENQILRLIDLAGNTVWETNAARVNEQLEAMGKTRMTSFHHDARLLPNGNVLVLAANEKILSDVQGPGDVDVLGDMIIELNRDFNVTWVWDAFEHMDVRRMALLDEKCVPGGGGCPTFHLAQEANDWLHGNSISVTADGGVLYSARHQDWIVKIDYGNGLGSGSVIWRLGKGGDFRLESRNDSDWFSHQHDANESIVANGFGLLLYDNGNTRQKDDATVHSRGQLFHVDEQSMTARLLLNADLGAYAFALGSASTLDNGNYVFGTGWTAEGGSFVSEFDPSGRLVWRLDSQTPTYRATRAASLYVLK